jgi:8-oxo-dGTP pyrophosphatase MutT (NUDIX family)
MSYIHWLREHVGTQKIILVYADVILRDEKGRILLQLRADDGYWGLAGGVLEIGETWEKCVRRELLEETGLTAGDLQLVGIYTDPRYDIVYPNGDAVQQFTVCFTGVVSGGEMRLDSAESVALQWFESDQLPRDRMQAFYNHMIDYALNDVPPAYLPPYSKDHTCEFYDRVRPFVGHDTLILPGAMVAVEREDGRLLVIQRTDTGEWWLPSGYMMLGENVASTAVREVEEETGIQIELGRILGVYSSPYLLNQFPNGDRVYNVGVLFHARPLSADIAFDSAEVRATEWITRADLLQRSAGYTGGELTRLTIKHLDSGVFLA